MANSIQPIIRLARLSEARVIARMSQLYIEAGLPWSWRPARVRDHIRAVDSVVVVADIVRDPQLAGFGIMHFAEDTAALCLLAVQPAYRRNGIAARLVRWLELTADTAGIVGLHIEAREDNDAARHLYEALGYHLIETLPGYYSGKTTAVRFAKRLRPPFEPSDDPVWLPGPLEQP
ncbi:MAG: GNAT family N-acetyltransferase [Pseudomonadota bacterium]